MTEDLCRRRQRVDSWDLSRTRHPCPQRRSRYQSGVWSGRRVQVMVINLYRLRLNI
jgi:hypothetical protein